MQNKEYILGLDISTSTIGISLFEDNCDTGQLVTLTHFTPKLKPKPKTKLEEYKEKADLCVKQITKQFKGYNITKIIVEDPLQNSASQKVAMILSLFNEYMTNKLSLAFDMPIDFITVYESRKNALPELVNDKDVFMGDFPNKVANLRKSKWSKFLIMYLVSQRYKGIKWLLNRAYKIDKKNFDRADSIIVVLGYMIKHGYWTKMGSADYWKDAKLDKESCVKIIKKNVAYELFCKNHVDKEKTLKASQKKQAKIRYLNEHFNIKDYFNISY